jgi:hypothetical protein
MRTVAKLITLMFFASACATTVQTGKEPLQTEPKQFTQQTLEQQQAEKRYQEELKRVDQQYWDELNKKIEQNQQAAEVAPADDRKEPPVMPEQSDDKVLKTVNTINSLIITPILSIMQIF